MTNRYIPDRNDIVYVDFNPQVGQEQAKRRPALILSPKQYNKYGMAILVPITKGKGRHSAGTFKVNLPDNSEIQGCAISDQIKSFDWQQRNAKKVAEVPISITSEIIARFKTLIE